MSRHTRPRWDELTREEFRDFGEDLGVPHPQGVAHEVPGFPHRERRSTTTVSTGEVSNSRRSRNATSGPVHRSSSPPSRTSAAPSWR